MRPPAVWLPRDLSDAYAIRAVSKGEADETAQKRALRCIVEEISGTYAMTYDPASDRNSCFAEGRRSVGRAIVGMLNIDLNAVKAAEERLTKQRIAPRGKRERKKANE